MKKRVKNRAKKVQKLTLRAETLLALTLRPEELKEVGGGCTEIVTCFCRKASFPQEACC